MQAAEFLVEIDQIGGDAGKTTFAHIGRIGDINSVRYRFEKALKSGFRLTLLGELIQRLFGFDDLFLGLGADLDLGGLGRYVTPELNEIAPDRQIIDHLA